MPHVIHQEGWESALRTGVRSSTASGWSVREQRGGIRLEVRLAGQSRCSVLLPFAWTRQDVGPILGRVRNIYLLTLEGYELSLAAEIAAGKAVKPAAATNWAEAKQHFREQKLHHGAAIQPVTWVKKYEPVLALALQLLASAQPPTTAVDLLDGCLRDWPPGSRTRQIRAQSLSQFLRHCVEREHFPDHWQPPARLQPHIGVPTRERAPGHRKGDPFDDLEILSLLDAMPGDVPGRRWADAVRLLAELGLRPIELQHLRVRRDPASGELIWWCDYRKRSGGGMTAPRRVHPLPLLDWDGRRQEWQLLARWQNGDLQLPPLGSSTAAPAVRKVVACAFDHAGA